MHRTRSLLQIVIPLLALSIAPVAVLALAEDKARPTEIRSQPDAEIPDDSSLRMSPAVACRSIDGYEQYERLDVPALTSDEKLLVYYRPRHYKIVRRERDYVVHFSQDGIIRRKGEKTVLRIKKRLLDVESTSQTSPDFLYLRNTVSLKDLPPGDYEFDIILRDENAPGSTAKQTLKFQIVPAKPVDEDARPSPENGAKPKTPGDSDSR
jgi:hypothetical protein